MIFRDVLPEHRFPDTTWEDAKTELYGAEGSVLFPDLTWGGMTTDTAIFIQVCSYHHSKFMTFEIFPLQSGLDIEDIDEQSDGET